MRDAPTTWRNIAGIASALLTLASVGVASCGRDAKSVPMAPAPATEDQVAEFWKRHAGPWTVSSIADLGDAGSVRETLNVTADHGMTDVEVIAEAFVTKFLTIEELNMQVPHGQSKSVHRRSVPRAGFPRACVVPASADSATLYLGEDPDGVTDTWELTFAGSSISGVHTALQNGKEQWWKVQGTVLPGRGGGGQAAAAEAAARAAAEETERNQSVTASAEDAAAAERRRADAERADRERSDRDAAAQRAASIEAVRRRISSERDQAAGGLAEIPGLYRTWNFTGGKLLDNDGHSIDDRDAAMFVRLRPNGSADVWVSARGQVRASGLGTWRTGTRKVHVSLDEGMSETDVGDLTVPDATIAWLEITKSTGAGAVRAGEFRLAARNGTFAAGDRNAGFVGPLLSPDGQDYFDRVPVAALGVGSSHGARVADLPAAEEAWTTVVDAARSARPGARDLLRAYRDWYGDPPPADLASVVQALARLPIRPGDHVAIDADPLPLWDGLVCAPALGGWSISAGDKKVADLVVDPATLTATVQGAIAPTMADTTAAAVVELTPAAKTLKWTTTATLRKAMGSSAPAPTAVWDDARLFGGAFAIVDGKAFRRRSGSWEKLGEYHWGSSSWMDALLRVRSAHRSDLRVRALPASGDERVISWISDPQTGTVTYGKFNTRTGAGKVVGTLRVSTVSQVCGVPFEIVPRGGGRFAALTMNAERVPMLVELTETGHSVVASGEPLETDIMLGLPFFCDLDGNGKWDYVAPVSREGSSRTELRVLRVEP